MVLLHIKRGNDKNEFLFESTVQKNVQEVVQDAVEVHNLRLKVQRLAVSMQELAKHGPIRPEETRGLSDETSKVSELDTNAYGAPTNPDPYGYRTGCPPPQAVADIMAKTADEALAAVAHTLVEQKKCLDLKTVENELNKLKGAVMIAYPAYHRLPHYDPARLECENREELDGRSEMQDILETSDTAMWWAGKDLQQDKMLHEYVGKNEKTKLVCRMQPKASGAPVRESRIDKDTHSAMLQHYHKKQEEEKKLREDEDDSYMESSWANPKSLKNALIGNGGNVNWRPGA
jgi:hypothetical protein